MARCPTCGQLILPRAGKALGLVAETIRIEHGERPFKVQAIVDRLQTISRKRIYNAIGYLHRHGKITKIGYGTYRAKQVTP